MPSTSVILSYESAAIETTAEALVPIATGGSMDHGLPHGGSRITDISVVSGENMDHGHQHGLQQRHRPRKFVGFFLFVCFVFCFSR